MDTNEYIFQCIITGQGGHGAMPNEAVDPIVAAAWVLPRLETIAAEENASIKWRQVHGGTRFNIIPEQIRFSGVLLTRASDFKLCTERLLQIARGAAQAFRVQCSLQFEGEEQMI